ncbi:hypothetical protein BJ508DRAFT_377373 [Ascobolus immersus RN42]|uniref:Uncharacterized protein n=1 Tax=Ascobolus immersus RN42 TaxID=1160509 RepID=A0A3N4I5Q0_ASCIM|nr:hypothetical protein BJ508DRAFT_377373 [Ascobolus immersus RN42]
MRSCVARIGINASHSNSTSSGSDDHLQRSTKTSASGFPVLKLGGGSILNPFEDIHQKSVSLSLSEDGPSRNSFEEDCRADWGLPENFSSKLFLEIERFADGSAVAKKVSRNPGGDAALQALSLARRCSLTKLLASDRRVVGVILAHSEIAVLVLAKSGIVSDEKGEKRRMDQAMFWRSSLATGGESAGAGGGASVVRFLGLGADLLCAAVPARMGNCRGKPKMGSITLSSSSTFLQLSISLPVGPWTFSLPR